LVGPFFLLSDTGKGVSCIRPPVHPLIIYVMSRDNYLCL
jgi:hypothetical protein